MASPDLCLSCKVRPQAADSDSGLCPVCLASDTDHPLATSFPDDGLLNRPVFIPGSSDGPTRAEEPSSDGPVEPPELEAAARAAEPAPKVAPGEPAPPELPPGYEYIRRLGGGGMGDVYLVRDELADRLLAFKFLKAANNSSGVTRFVTELQSLARVMHPNVVKVIHHDFYRSQPFLVMEYVRGGTLAELVERNGPLAPRDAVAILLIVAKAVSAVHAEKVIHRDLKPSNILLAPKAENEQPSLISELSPKVSDFGLAKRLDDEDGDQTTTHAPIGTAAFMPPEQVSRRYGEIGDHTDVYSLGSTLYYVLTGRPPFQGSRDEVLMQVPRAEPNRLRAIPTVHADVDETLEAIVHKCLEKRPGDRYHTAADLAADLQHYLDGNLEKITAIRLTRVRRLRRWGVRNRNQLLAACGVMVALTLTAMLPPRTDHTPAAPPDPLGEITKGVLKGNPQEIVGATIPKHGAPRWFNWLTGGAIFEPSPLGDGACSFQSLGELSLLQLVAPPTDRYRVTAQVQMVNANFQPAPSVEPSVGMFMGHVDIPRRQGPPNRGVWVIDFLDLNRNPALQKATPQRSINLSWIEYVRNDRGASARQRQGVRSLKFKPLADFPGPWWTITMDVTPDRVLVQAARGDEKPQVLADLTRDQIRHQMALYKKSMERVQKEHLAQAPPGTPPVDFGTLPDDWDPRGPIGIWCQHSRVAFKNVVVSPLP